jgi:hypothetical protein
MVQKFALLLALFIASVATQTATATDYRNHTFDLGYQEACCFDSKYTARSKLGDIYYRLAYSLCEEQGGEIALATGTELISITESYSKNDDNLWVAIGSGSVTCSVPYDKNIGSGVRG